MCQKTGYSQSLKHSRPVECCSRQAIQTRPDHSNRMVTPPGGLPNNMQKVAPASNRPFCNKVQQETGQFCVTNTRSPGLGSRCTQPFMGGSGSICLPTSSHLGQSGGETTGLPVSENNSDCSRVAQHALVLGSSGHVQPNPTEPAQSAQPTHSAIQSDSSQESVQPKSACMAPRASAIKEHGFSL